ncbi:MAG TPA: hypothetical protein VGN52_02900 [Burkholderiales bacterium]|jgi:hypothetical protein
MDQRNVNTARLTRFTELYQAVLGKALDVEEFFCNDVYALSAIHRAANTRDAELRNLAAHLEIEHQAHVEPVTVKNADPLGKTWKLGVLPAGAGMAPSR